MLSRLRLPSPALALSTIAVVLAAGGFAVAAIPDGNGKVNACYSKKTGALRVVSSSKKKCRRGERKLSWSQKGPAGPTGPKGASGDVVGFTGSPAGGDLQGTYPNPTVKKAPATRILQDAALSNGWANADPANTRLLGYFKDNEGVVHLQGRAYHSPATSSKILTLPVGMRPNNLVYVAAVVGSGDPGYVRVDPNGDVSTIITNEVSLEGVTFRADQ